MQCNLSIWNYSPLITVIIFDFMISKDHINTQNTSIFMILPQIPGYLCLKEYCFNMHRCFELDSFTVWWHLMQTWTLAFCKSKDQYINVFDNWFRINTTFLIHQYSRKLIFPLQVSNRFLFFSCWMIDNGFVPVWMIPTTILVSFSQFPTQFIVSPRQQGSAQKATDVCNLGYTSENHLNDTRQKSNYCFLGLFLIPYAIAGGSDELKDSRTVIKSMVPCLSGPSKSSVHNIGLYSETFKKVENAFSILVEKVCDLLLNCRTIHCSSTVQILPCSNVEIEFPFLTGALFWECTQGAGTSNELL